MIAHASLNPNQSPSTNSILETFESDEVQELLRRRVTLLQCTSEYPTPVNELNLRAIDTLRKAFGVRIGFSDHSEGIFAAVAAAALGSVVIEKHFIDRKHFIGISKNIFSGSENILKCFFIERGVPPLFEAVFRV